MPDYRITRSNAEECGSIIESFGAKNDIEAKERFVEKYKYNPNYSWDCLRLIRIVQTEKTVVVDSYNAPK